MYKRQLLDLGCGSGILSIAGVLLGAAHAVGVDIDPVAERIAGENAALNGVQGDRYTVLCGDVLTDGDLVNRLAQSTYDIVAANIVADVIIGLCPVVPRFLKQDGLFIMSGIKMCIRDSLLAHRRGRRPLQQPVVFSQYLDWPVHPDPDLLCPRQFPCLQFLSERGR